VSGGLEKTLDACQEQYLRMLQRALDVAENPVVRLPLLGEYKRILASYSMRQKYEDIKQFHEYIRKVTGK
jgi:hypothetical protein